MLLIWTTIYIQWQFQEARRHIGLLLRHFSVISNLNIKPFLTSVVVSLPVSNFQYYINTWSRRDHGLYNPATSTKVSRSRVVSVSKFQTFSTGIVSVSGTALSKVFSIVILVDCKLPLPSLVCADSSNYTRFWNDTQCQ